MALPTIRFYRGASGVSLPAYRNGAIFVVQKDVTEDADQNLYYGDIYVDVDNGARLHITPNDTIYTRTTRELQQNAPKGEISERGRVYVVFDDTNLAPNKLPPPPTIRVGDGTSYVRDLPSYYCGITEIEKNIWNNKVTAYVTEVTSAVDSSDFILHLSKTETTG